MPGERLELNDMGRFSSETNLTEGKKFPWGGCYLNTALGFVLVLLAVLIAVGVGVVVYFAAGREVVCKCGRLEVNDGVVSSEVMRQCQGLAERGNPDVCEYHLTCVSNCRVVFVTSVSTPYLPFSGGK